MGSRCAPCEKSGSRTRGWGQGGKGAWAQLSFRKGAAGRGQSIPAQGTGGNKQFPKSELLLEVPPNTSVEKRPSQGLWGWISALTRGVGESELFVLLGKSLFLSWPELPWEAAGSGPFALERWPWFSAGESLCMPIYNRFQHTSGWRLVGKWKVAVAERWKLASDIKYCTRQLWFLVVGRKSDRKIFSLSFFHSTSSTKVALNYIHRYWANCVCSPAHHFGFTSKHAYATEAISTPLGSSDLNDTGLCCLHE